MPKPTSVAEFRAIVDYLCWWPIRGRHIQETRERREREPLDPLPVYADVYQRLHGISIDDMHARRVAEYGDPRDALRTVRSHKPSGGSADPAGGAAHARAARLAAAARSGGDPAA